MTSQYLKQSNMSISSSQTTNNNNNNLEQLRHSQSYNELLNLRTTLLHMQHLYSSLDQSLSRQHINQSNQHKDHLIQCFNLKQELEQTKKSNYNKLFIVKLEELLAIEQEVNQKLMQQPRMNDIRSNKTETDINDISKIAQSPFIDPFLNSLQIIPTLDKLMTYIQIKQEQMQHSLCKLYIGNKVLLDLQKTSQSILQIQAKIDNFLSKHQNVLEKYNGRVNELEDTKGMYKGYVENVQKKVEGLCFNSGSLIKGQQQMQKIRTNNKDKRNQQYQKHVKARLIQEQKQIQNRITNLKQNLLTF